MRVGIYGAGAVGGHLAARLAMAGHDVCVVARGPHLEALRAGGLMLRTPGGEHVVPVFATDRPDSCAPVEALFVTVKATGLRRLHEAIRPLISPDTLVVFAQNGMPWWYPVGLPPDKPPPPRLPLFDLGPEFLSIMTVRQIVGGVVHASSEVVEPGVILNTSARNGLAIGYADDRDDSRLQELRRRLAASGFDSPHLPQIREAVWLKLMRNMSSGPIAAITGNRTGIVRTDPSLGEVFLAIVQEGMSVARAAGYPLDELTTPQRLLDETIDVVPSLLQDLRLSRPVEIDELLSAPLRFAQEAGIDVPVTAAITAILRRMAADLSLLPNP